MKKLQKFCKLNLQEAFAFLLVCALIGFLFIRAFSYATTSNHSYTATVTETKELPTGGGLPKHLVVTRLVDTNEVHVFEVSNSFLRFRFDSSKVYNSIEIGKTYIFNVYGYCNEDFREYENILSVEEVSSKTKEPL